MIHSPKRAGYYRPGDWGIRIENLVMWREPRRSRRRVERAMMDFETLTLAPYRNAPRSPNLMTAAESPIALGIAAITRGSGAPSRRTSTAADRAWSPLDTRSLAD